MKISKEVKIGLLTFTALLILFFGYSYIKGSDLLGRRTELIAVYKNASGLSASNPVYLYGLKVGRVEKINIDYNGEPSIIVNFSVSPDTRVPVNSTAKIVSSDIMGSKAIEIIPSQNTSYAESGDTLAGQVERSITESVTEVINPLQQKTVSLISSLDSVITIFQEVMDKETKDDIESSFRSIANTLKNLERTSGRFDNLVAAESERLQRILSNIEDISLMLADNKDNIRNITQNMSDITDSLAAADIKNTLNHANSVLADLDKTVDKINNGEGTLGSLVNDDKLYNDLNRSVKNLDRLISDIKKNPHRYLNFSVISIGGGGNQGNNPPEK